MSDVRFLNTLRRSSKAVLNRIANIEIIGSIDYPEGAYIATANHIGRLEVLLVLVLSDRNDIVLLLAEKYRKYAIWRYIAEKTDAIWVNRFDADLGALRKVLKRLKQGDVLAIAPEGTRSPTEALIEGKPGAAFLAYKADVPIIPIGIVGTEDRIVKSRLKRFQKLDIVARVGTPYRLAPQQEGQDRETYMQAQTDEIMCRIAALLPPDHRGVYTDHPRLRELLIEQGSPFPEDAEWLAAVPETSLDAAKEA
ncbi:MAG: lysophospholipid acyltransferase family protein [Chloroflexota bacterium]